MKKILDLVLGTFLSWFDKEAFGFAFALVLAQLGFLGAEPVADVPMANIAFMAFLFGTLMTAVLLTGTEIVCHKTYNWRSLLAGVAGSLIGVAVMWLCTIVY